MDCWRYYSLSYEGVLGEEAGRGGAQPRRHGLHLGQESLGQYLHHQHRHAWPSQDPEKNNTATIIKKVGWGVESFCRRKVFNKYKTLLKRF